ncbi:DNA replication intitiation control protein YabA [Staphylococcus aureus]|nr:DNA replication intitiation control protein YabA [Staphylococcus aureus]
MDRNEIFEKIMRLEMNVNQLSKETSELKALAVELVEENVALQLENDNLKKYWAMMNQLLLIL